MKVVVADVLGMCFGVRDALELIEKVEQPERVTIHGELVHNEKVLDRLATRGFQQTDERSRTTLPLTDTVLVTAHGISNRERQRLEEAGKALIDSTCPLVRRAHDAAQKLQRDGYFVLVIGKRGHVEVQGIIEDLDAYEVIQSPEEVQEYLSSRLGVMCQTTMPQAHAASILEAIRARNPDADVRVIDTICHPTKDHQKALEDLLDQVEVVIVVGGKNSNNTRQLALRCEERGKKAYHIQTPDDLREEWFAGVQSVGLTAGTSTLEETIREVHEALLSMSLARTMYVQDTTQLHPRWR